MGLGLGHSRQCRFWECLEKQSVKQHDVAGQGRQTATPPSRARRRSYTHEHGTQSTAPSERCPDQKPEGDEAGAQGEAEEYGAWPRTAPASAALLPPAPPEFENPQLELIPAH